MTLARTWVVPSRPSVAARVPDAPQSRGVGDEPGDTGTMTNTNGSQTPAYAQLCNAILADLRDAGVELKPCETVIDGIPGNRGWAKFERLDGQKIYVRRSDADGIIHTSFEVPESTPGHVSHLSPTGRDRRPTNVIRSFFKADAELVRRHLIPLFLRASGTPGTRLVRAPRDASAAASGQEPQGPVATEVQAAGLDG